MTALRGILGSVWQQVNDVAATSGPEILPAGLPIAVSTPLFLAVSRLTFMALSRPLTIYGSAVCRAYPLGLTLSATWGLIRRCLSVQIARWNSDTGGTC